MTVEYVKIPSVFNSNYGGFRKEWDSIVRNSYAQMVPLPSGSYEAVTKSSEIIGAKMGTTGIRIGFELTGKTAMGQILFKTLYLTASWPTGEEK